MASAIMMPPTTTLAALNSNCPALGEVCYYGGNFYRFVKHVNAVTVVVGHSAEFTNVACTNVTNDRAGGAATPIGTQLLCAGIYISIPAANEYCFLQVSGIALVLGDGSVAAGEAVILHSVDGQADTMAAGEEHQVFGYALDADDTANDPLATSALFHCMLTNCAF